MLFSATIPQSSSSPPLRSLHGRRGGLRGAPGRGSTSSAAAVGSHIQALPAATRFVFETASCSETGGAGREKGLRCLTPVSQLGKVKVESSSKQHGYFIFSHPESRPENRRGHKEQRGAIIRDVLRTIPLQSTAALAARIHRQIHHFCGLGRVCRPRRNAEGAVHERAVFQSTLDINGDQLTRRPH